MQSNSFVMNLVSWLKVYIVYICRSFYTQCDCYKLVFIIHTLLYIYYTHIQYHMKNKEMVTCSFQFDFDFVIVWMLTTNVIKVCQSEVRQFFILIIISLLPFSSLLNQ